MAGRFRLVGWFLTVACSGPAPQDKPVESPSAPSTLSVGEFVDQLGATSLAQWQIEQGTSADQVYVAVMVDAEGKISGEPRPVLGGQFELAMSGASTLSLHGPLEPDPSCVVTIEITDAGDKERARIVNPTTGADQKDLGVRSKLRVSIRRDPKTTPSEKARLRAASLWALIGENVRTPSAPAQFEAAVIGIKLVRGDVPALFERPGSGTWVLLKTTTPDELYVAFDMATGRGELFPKTPNVPNDAARVVFRAL